MGYTSNVVSQGSTKTCWAHAVIASCESSMIMKGIADNNVNFAESHLIWYTKGQDITDTSSPLYNEYDANIYKGVECYESGGYDALALNTLARGNGPVFNDYAPDVVTRPVFDESKRYQYNARLQFSESYSFEDQQSVKEAIMTKSALYASYTSDAGYTFNPFIWETSYYYNKTHLPDVAEHAIAIVGWDDNYSRFNFVNGGTPSKDGAWLCKNSGGTSSKDICLLSTSQDMTL